MSFANSPGCNCCGNCDTLIVDATGTTDISEWEVDSGSWAQVVDGITVLENDVAGRIRYETRITDSHVIQIRIRAETTNQIVSVKVFNEDFSEFVELELTVGGTGQIVDHDANVLSGPFAHSLTASLVNWTTVSVSINGGQLHFSGPMTAVTVTEPTGFIPAWYAVETDNLLSGVVQLSHLVVTNEWSIVAGDWKFNESAKLLGEENSAVLITEKTLSGGQYVEAKITANAAGQVIDIMLGCDSSGTPDLYARVTFGDSAVTNSCGTIQLFHNGTALEAAMPNIGLVDGTEFTFTMCTDAALSKWTFHRSTAGVQYKWTAALPTDADGRLGFKIVNAQSSDMEVEVEWYRVFITGTDCKNCAVCGTPMDGVNLTAGGESSTCEFTLSNAVGTHFQTVDALTVVSELDRDLGYGCTAGAAVRVFTTEGKSLVVYADNGHHEAKLHLSNVKVGDCTPSTSNTHRIEYYVEILKNDVVIATSATKCYGTGVGSPPLNFTDLSVSLKLIFCGGDVLAEAGDFLSASTSATSSQVGDGDTHGTYLEPEAYASLHNFDYIKTFTTNRCLECSQCENCDSYINDVTWQVVIDVDDNTWDGTYVVPAFGSSCGASYVVSAGFSVVLAADATLNDTTLTVNALDEAVATGTLLTFGGATCSVAVDAALGATSLTVTPITGNASSGTASTETNAKYLTLTKYRSHFFVELRPTAVKAVHSSGKSSDPLTDCEGVTSEAIAITGLVEGTATLTAL